MLTCCRGATRSIRGLCHYAEDGCLDGQHQRSHLLVPEQLLCDKQIVLEPWRGGELA